MVCVWSCALAIIFIAGMVYTMYMSDKTELIQNFMNILTEEQRERYNRIREERLKIYYQGFGLGILFSLVIIIIYIVQDISGGEVEENIFSDNLAGTFYALIAAALNAVLSILDQKTSFEFHPYVILSVTGFFMISFSPILMSLCKDEFSMDTANFTLLFLCGASCFFRLYFHHKSIDENFFSRWRN